MRAVYQYVDRFLQRLFSNREYISDQQLLVMLYMKSRDTNIELVATLKAPSLLIIGVEQFYTLYV